MGKVRLRISVVVKRERWFPDRWYDRYILMLLW